MEMETVELVHHMWTVVKDRAHAVFLHMLWCKTQKMSCTDRFERKWDSCICVERENGQHVLWAWFLSISLSRIQMFFTLQRCQLFWSYFCQCYICLLEYTLFYGHLWLFCLPVQSNNLKPCYIYIYIYVHYSRTSSRENQTTKIQTLTSKQINLYRISLAEGWVKHSTS